MVLYFRRNWQLILDSLNVTPCISCYSPIILFGYLTRIFLNLSITTHSHSYGPVERINPGESCNQYLPGICIMLVLDVRINPNYFRFNSCLQNSDPRVTTNPPSCHARTKSSCKYEYRQVQMTLASTSSAPTQILQENSSLNKIV